MEKEGLHIPAYFLIVLGVLFLLIVLLVAIPRSCDNAGSCRASCAPGESKAARSCGIEFYKSCCVTNPCTDECPSDGMRVCEGSGYKECGNYDDDYCREWSDILPCGFNESCSDGLCGQTNRGSACQFNENCSMGLRCKESGRYGTRQRYCCYNFECASILDPNGVCVIDGGQDILENGSSVVCKNGNWTIPTSI